MRLRISGSSVRHGPSHSCEGNMVYSVCVCSPQTVPLCLNSLPSSSKRDARDITVFNTSLLDRHFVPVPPGADSLTPSRLILYHTLVPRTQNQTDLRTWPSGPCPACSAFAHGLLSRVLPALGTSLLLVSMYCVQEGNQASSVLSDLTEDVDFVVLH